MEPFFGLAVLTFIGLLIWAWRHQQRVRAAADVAWRYAAEELGGTFTPAESDWSPPIPRRIVATLEGVRVELDHYDTGGENSTTYTRARASARAPEQLSITVDPISPLSALGTALGFQDVEIGDRGFDDVFTVKASDPDVARVWLNRVVRERIVARDGFSFQLDKGRVVVKAAILLHDYERLEALAWAAAAFADGTRELRRTWRRVARSLGGTVKTKDDWPVLTVELDGVPIGVKIVERREGYDTLATAQLAGRRIAELELTCESKARSRDLQPASGVVLPEGYQLYGRAPDWAARAMTREVLQLVERLGPTWIRVDAQRVRVTWPGICSSARQLRRAIELCAELANGPGRDAYR